MRARIGLIRAAIAWLTMATLAGTAAWAQHRSRAGFASPIRPIRGGAKAPCSRSDPSCSGGRARPPRRTKA